jgi:hypothetical protein
MDYVMGLTMAETEETALASFAEFITDFEVPTPQVTPSGETSMTFPSLPDHGKKRSASPPVDEQQKPLPA